ncbi:MAG: hypothetical protein AAFR11_03175 [Pseudomonadota bacterium]
MADTTYHRGDMDVAEQEKTFRRAMDVAKFIGIPACLGVTGLVTGLLSGAGVFGSLFAMIVLFFGAFFVARAFFPAEH